MIEYYNVLESGHGIFGFAATGLGMIAIGIIVIILMRMFNAKRSKQIFMYFWTGFGVLWTVIAFLSTGSDYLECKRVMKNGTYKEVEGFVEFFDPMPYEGHKNETFIVNGVPFGYSDYVVTCGFNNTKSHGGPIDEGKYVRIRYYEGKILQLWIKDEQLPTSK